MNFVFSVFLSSGSKGWALSLAKKTSGILPGTVSDLPLTVCGCPAWQQTATCCYETEGHVVRRILSIFSLASSSSNPHWGISPILTFTSLEILFREKEKQIAKEKIEGW